MPIAMLLTFPQSVGGRGATVDGIVVLPSVGKSANESDMESVDNLRSNFAVQQRIE